jgi:hypothetical protein
MIIEREEINEASAQYNHVTLFNTVYSACLYVYVSECRMSIALIDLT